MIEKGNKKLKECIIEQNLRVKVRFGLSDLI